MNFFYQSYSSFLSIDNPFIFQGVHRLEERYNGWERNSIRLESFEVFLRNSENRGKKIFVAQRFARMESRSGSGTPDLRNGSGTSFGGGINPSGR